MSGPATKKLFERAYQVYGDPAYERLAFISVSHLYNLRKGDFYRRQRRHFTKTQKSAISIGERRKPNPQGKPGYIRIDTVHQGDQDKQKGVYHINAVDEVTQFEVICSVEKISENYLIPVLEELLATFPFVIINFHSDNRHHLTPYLNFHRPCYFAEIKIDIKGKEKKVYPYRSMMTPYEKLKSLPNAASYLKADTNFEILELQMLSSTDLQAAKAMKKAQSELFRQIFNVGSTDVMYRHPSMPIEVEAATG